MDFFLTHISSYPTLSIFLALLGGYFLVEAMRFYQKTKQLSNQISSFQYRVDQEDSSLQENTQWPVRAAWERYRRTFLPNKEKTEVNAKQFFDESTLTAAHLDLRYWKSVPNLLVGVGILGTFTGLTFGVTSFDTETAATIQNSIETLLSGMATAFISSIAGMALSILFNIGEKWRFGVLRGKIQELCVSLDRRFILTEEERRLAEKEQDRALLMDLFAFEENGGTVLPAHVFRDLRREAENQTTTLKSFSTDLADGIMLSSMTIEQMGGELGEVFQAVMQKRMTPAMEGVREAVEELRSEKTASNEEMVENIVSQLSETLEGVGNQFQDALSGGALSQLENTAETIGQTGELLQTFQSGFESMTEDLKESLSAMAEQTGREAERAASSMREETEAATRRMREEVESVTQGVSNELSALQTTSADLLSQQQQNTETVETVLQESGQVAQDLSATSSGLNDTLAHLNEAASSLRDTAQSAQSSGASLETSSAQFQEHQDQWLQDEKETLHTLERTLDRMKDLTGQFSNQFDVIHDGLGKTGTFLDTFQEDLEDATRGLESSLRSLTEHAGEETEAITTSVQKNMQEASRALWSEVENVTAEFGQTIEGLQSNSADLLEKQKQNATVVQAVLQEGRETAGQLNKTTSSLDGTLSRLETVSTHLRDAAEQAKESGRVLQISSTEMKRHQKEWLNTERDTLVELKDNLEAMRNLSSTYVRQFETIRKGISDIFGELDRGLQDYRNTTRDSLNTFLSDFADNLQTATNALNGTVHALDESFEDLHEIFDKMDSGGGRGNGRR